MSLISYDYHNLTLLACLSGATIAWCGLQYPQRFVILFSIWAVVVPTCLIGAWWFLEDSRISSVDFWAVLTFCSMGLFVICLCASRLLRIARGRQGSAPDEQHLQQLLTSSPDDRGISDKARLLNRIGFLSLIPLMIATIYSRSNVFNDVFGVSLMWTLVSVGCICVLWLSVTATRSLRDDFAVRMIRAIYRNRGTHFILRRRTLFIMYQGLRRPKALLYWLVAIVSLSLSIGQRSVIGRSLIGSILQLVLIAAVVQLWRKGTQHALHQALKREEVDTRPYTLFLRSFMDEEVILLHRGLRGRVRFEEIVANCAWPLGTVVTIAKPGDKLPQLGSIRLGVSGQPGHR